MKRVLFSLIGAVAIMASQVSQAAELNEQQRNAVTLLENAYPDAVEALHQLRIGRMKPKDLGWDYYQKWMIGPTQKALEACKTAKVPAEADIDMHGHKEPFSKVQAQAATIEADYKAAFAADPNDKIGQFKASQPPECIKRYEAFKAEMTKGLSGDKLRIMNEEILITAVAYYDPPKFIVGYYGEGKKLLTTPEDFANAKIWATTDYVFASDDTLKTDPHWRVYVYHFDGMKVVHKTSDRGPGKVAPDSYFQFKAE